MAVSLRGRLAALLPTGPPAVPPGSVRLGRLRRHGSIVLVVCITGPVAAAVTTVVLTMGLGHVVQTPRATRELFLRTATFDAAALAFISVSRGAAMGWVPARGVGAVQVGAGCSPHHRCAHAGRQTPPSIGGSSFTSFRGPCTTSRPTPPRPAPPSTRPRCTTSSSPAASRRSARRRCFAASSSAACGGSSVSSLRVPGAHCPLRARLP
jgi:hypothetical protein